MELSRPQNLAPLTLSDEQIARTRALFNAADPDVDQQNINGYTGSQYGKYTREERQVAKSLLLMYKNRTMAPVRFQGGFVMGAKPYRSLLLGGKRVAFETPEAWKFI